MSKICTSTMMLIRPLLSKGSFFGSLISRVRTTPIASITISSPTSQPSVLSKAKSLEEKVGLPPRPKKPLTPFFRFLREVRPKILQNNPNIKAMDIIRTATKQWETIDEKSKDRLQNEYNREKQIYVELRTKYDAQITDQQKADMKQLKQEAADLKQRRILRKRVKELGRPKKPASSFLRFLANERKVLPQASNQTFREWHKKATEKWSRLSDIEKEPFMVESRKELEEYKKEIAVWEQKMIRMGNADVVRFGSLIDPPEPKPKKH